ncbi:PadR family transcriptional regulator [Rhodococcus sp. UNC363MFTsu5.1]|uniref:PadR family transcriptional regulator n=1 Tax=Rhodococcus sp. UNC363MFTsu5.1 TaxID=1449069 RepID=UPI0009DE69BE|nr:PadR family transcriptional regulator [Rhodococcus sp. UNC363MFTsu5.1]
MFTFGEKLTGNDLKRWADLSVKYFYWGPSLSQVYSELKKLEDLDLVRSTVVCEPGIRARRVYEITHAGVGAIRAWSHSAPVELPVLKHGVVLRLWMGHLNDPEHLKFLVTEHIKNLCEIRDRAGAQAARSDRDPAWAFTALSLRWSQRYFQAEIDLARGLLEDIDTAAREYSRVEEFDEWDLPRPIAPGSWRVGEVTDGAPAAED